VEELSVRAAQDFEAFYQERQNRANEESKCAALVVLTSDGKGVVMRREDLREATRKAAARKKHKLKTRLTRGEKRNAKRMATVASVYTIDPYVRTPEEVGRAFAPVHEVERAPRPRPEAKRVWASLEKRPREVLEEAFAEATSRDPERTKTWVALVDGDPTQIRHFEELAREQEVTLTIILDGIHVLEYLWKAGVAFQREGTPDLESWVVERFLAVLRGRACHVAAGMRRSATRQGLTAEVRKPVDTCANYLLKYKRFLA
jgi:hypothetical protein